MKYPRIPDYKGIAREIELYSRLKHEYSAKNIGAILTKGEKALRTTLAELKNLPGDRSLAQKEPNRLSDIRKLRPRGPRKIWEKFDQNQYAEKIEGALLGRMAGCTLGAIVEGWPIEKMQKWAKEIGDTFPPVDYWSAASDPSRIRYQMSRCDSYTRKLMEGVPVDDDIAYTLLGLLVVEDFGINFTIEENGKAWLKYLPYACTAEKVALQNLREGKPAKKAGEINNPYWEWIGADIRSDPWGYMAPGWPERAADMAYRDAYLSHRRNGIYGEMFFAAAIAAAFAVESPVEALEIALTEIPRNCSLAKAVRWALRTGKKIKDYKQARKAVDERFEGMSAVHTINNACLTIFGLMIGGTNLTKVISETVAMGLDNDCTTATAGSVVGAIVGTRGISRHWYKNFHNTVHSYLIGRRRFTIAGLVKRFARQARIMFGYTALQK